jgi:hypothetical protein
VLAGKKLGGVAFVVTNRNIYDSSRLGLEVLAALQHFYTGKLGIAVNARLIGSLDVIAALERGDDPKQILSSEKAARDLFLVIREPYLIYH